MGQAGRCPGVLPVTRAKVGHTVRVLAAQVPGPLHIQGVIVIEVDPRRCLTLELVLGDHIHHQGTRGAQKDFMHRREWVAFCSW